MALTAEGGAGTQQRSVSELMVAARVKFITEQQQVIMVEQQAMVRRSSCGYCFQLN
jgi:hypothetical protein